MTSCIDFLVAMIQVTIPLPKKAIVATIPYKTIIAAITSEKVKSISKVCIEEIDNRNREK